MKIAFVDVAGNRVEGFEKAEALAQELVSDLTLVQFTSPDFLKVPASCARVLGEGADAAIVFATLTAGQWRDYGSLVLEKIIDVEIHSAKFVFTAFVFEDEWRTEGKLAIVLEDKLRGAIEMAAGMKHATSTTSESPALPEAPPAMNMFSLPTENSDSPGSGNQTPPSTGGGSSLF